ncbi:MAG: dCTP deaminase [Candidatus Omnitrophica bacterium]|nr:dCTP deaminase [Candidatus Omnitrophota bacterium]MCM8827728.1 dCTP deaminase [Candidatus Omnitrophota bacterium]
MVFSDKWIKRNAKKGMIEPFFISSVKNSVMSYGVSSYGYDFKLADEFKIFIGKNPIDPKNPDSGSFIDFTGKVCEIPPHSFALGRSVEYFRIPRNCLGICFGKSSYARSGIVVYVTPLEPEWEGNITVMIANLAPVPNRVYADEGICQVVFLKASSVCEKSYADKKGKYQKSCGIILGR